MPAEQKAEQNFLLKCFKMKNKRIIKKNFEFQKVISFHTVVKNSSFVIYYSKVNDFDKKYLQYGITVSQKIGNAPLRNRIKRQMRHMINNQLNKYGDLPYRIVIIAKMKFLEKTFFDNNQNLEELLLKLLILG